MLMPSLLWGNARPRAREWPHPFALSQYSLLLPSRGVFRIPVCVSFDYRQASNRVLMEWISGLILEVEFHGGILVDREAVARDAQRIKDGEDPAPVLVDSAERAVRILGAEINRIEAAIRERFPQAVAIDVEVN